MKLTKRLGLMTAAALGAMAVGVTAQAAPVALAVDYYTVAGTYGGPGSGDADFNTDPCCIGTPYTDEITNTLGPDGLPVYNTAFTEGPALHDVNSNGELTWWSPSQNANVTYTGSGVVTLPYANYNFYPTNGTGSNDADGFQTAIFRGELIVPTTEAVQFSFGADDDAFLALGNTIISQEGGIHGVDAAPVVTPVLSAGDYALTLFYADRHETGAACTSPSTPQAWASPQSLRRRNPRPGP